MLPAGYFAELVSSDRDLFEEARGLARRRELVLASPLVMTRSCDLVPLCRHCSWRANRSLMSNYANAGTSPGEAVSRAARIQRSGVPRVYLVSGWMANALPEAFFECVEGVKTGTSLDVTVTFGAIRDEDLRRLKALGVDRVSCALETTNPAVFHHLKPGDDYGRRLRTLEFAKEIGFRTATDFLIGIGESIEDLDDSVRLAEALGIDFLSVSSLDPTPFTESETWDRPKPYHVARVTAAMRLALPGLDITGSFGCNTYADMAWGMRAGANAFTVALRDPTERPELLGDEASRLRVMWDDDPSLGRAGRDERRAR